MLLNEIVRFQDRMYHKNPAKARAKRRFVIGIREVTKHLHMNKLKCVILAPNCEKIQSKGGLDEAINLIIQTAIEKNVPFLFALGRKLLGKAINKLVPVSVVGIFDYAGAEEHFRRLVDLANNAKLAYQEIIEEYEKEECDLLLSQVEIVDTSQNSNNHCLIPCHMSHSRTSSNGSVINPLLLNAHAQTLSAHSDLDDCQQLTHSRTPSNCSNMSFMSRLSEPVSELGSSGAFCSSGITTPTNKTNLNNENNSQETIN